LAEAVGMNDSQAELTELGPDEMRLAAIAAAGGGMVGPDADATVRPTPTSSPAIVALWPFALLLAAFLVTVDLWLRRLGRAPRRHISELVRSPDVRAVQPESM
jgi:hypothetical protein